jgi:dihydroorotate dehydrogenase (fumarate)
MSLETTYLGLTLKNPVIAGASYITGSIDRIKKLEDNGIGAVVMHSIFEEQINHEAHELDFFLFQGSASYAEAMEYFADLDNFDNIESEDYLKEISEIKKSVDIPVIASLNGVSSGGWMKFATKLEEAGADALELNIIYIPTDPKLDGRAVEQIYIDDIKTVRENVKIPVSLKMTPFFSAPLNMAQKFVEAGVNGLVLFDRQASVDIDIENLETQRKITLTDSSTLSEALRWTGIMFDRVDTYLCTSGGVHTYQDVLKSIMSGADAVQMVSAIIKNGEEYVSKLLEDLTLWMREEEYESIRQMRGSLSLKNTPNPAAYERANYMRALQEFQK